MNRSSSPKAEAGQETGDSEEDKGGDNIEKDAWIDGLRRYSFRDRLFIMSDPHGVLVKGSGSSMWCAGEVLADFFNDRPELCKGQACLELGAGLGAVGMTIAKNGASRVVLTDQKRQVPLLQRNVEENFPGEDRVHAQELDWTIPEQRVGLGPWNRTLSLIVGSDIAYDPDLFEPLLLTLQLQSNWSTSIYLALADRHEEEDEPTIDEFREEAESAGFVSSEVYERQLRPFQSVTRVIRLARQPLDGR